MHYRRIFIPGATYFFTVNLLNRKLSLLTKNIEILRHSFNVAKTQYPFHIDAIVVLPDHLHAIISLPEGDSNYSLRWNIIKGNFTKNISPIESISDSRKLKGERGVWQRRFWEHTIRDESDLTNHINYIHYNPVKHGHVTSPIDWPHSSIHQYIKKGILQPDWACESSFEDISFGE